jgi:hypothetical protein
VFGQGAARLFSRDLRDRPSRFWSCSRRGDDDVDIMPPFLGPAQVDYRLPSVGCLCRALLAFGAFRQAKSPSFPCHTLNRHPERGEPYA